MNGCKCEMSNLWIVARLRLLLFVVGRGGPERRKEGEGKRTQSKKRKLKTLGRNWGLLSVNWVDYSNAGGVKKYGIRGTLIEATATISKMRDITQENMGRLTHPSSCPHLTMPTKTLLTALVGAACYKYLSLVLLIMTQSSFFFYFYKHFKLFVCFHERTQR